jgi:hypothetical protein
MVDQLSAFADEIIRVACEAGTERCLRGWSRSRAYPQRTCWEPRQ